MQLWIGGVPATESIPYGAFSTRPEQVAFFNLVAMQHHAWYWFQQRGTNLPADGSRVQAVIDGVVCGEATIEAPPGAQIAGFSRLIVPDAQIQPGCGRPGAIVSFLFDGVATGDPIEWRPGLQYINPFVGQPILPTTGSGSSSQDRFSWPVLAALLVAGGTLIAGARLLAARRR